MSNFKFKFKFSDDAKTVFFYPSPDIVYHDDKDAPKLKRLAPRRPPLNPAPPEDMPQPPSARTTKTNNLQRIPKDG